MRAINRAGNDKRVTTHPRRRDRRENANREIPRTPAEQLKRLNDEGYAATKQRKKLKALV